jgi:hypothetical protein
MIWLNEADVPKMVTKQGKWLDGKDIFFELTWLTLSSWLCQKKSPKGLPVPRVSNVCNIRQKGFPVI